MRVTPNFPLSELTHSNNAIRAGLNNTPDEKALHNLRRLCETLEIIRANLGNHPVSISSAYRSPEVNRLAKGSATSQHMMGLAADFNVWRVGNPLEICNKIVEMKLPFDQLIHEFGSWVHLSVAPEDRAPRRQLLTIDRLGIRQGLHKAR